MLSMLKFHEDKDAVAAEKEIKRGLMLGIKEPQAWQVYGLFCRKTWWVVLSPPPN